MSVSSLDRRQLASILGGPTNTDGHVIARHAYRLGMAAAPDADVFIVRLIEAVPGIGMTFEADSLEAAFERALSIAEDLAAGAGHLEDGVVVSVEQFGSMSEIGLGAD